MQQWGKLVVCGLGYVGLPLAMRGVEVGWDVVGVDTDEVRVKRLAGGESYVEDVTAAQAASAVLSGRFLPTASYEATDDFDVAVITVPTPLRDGNPDLTYIEGAARALSTRLTHGALVVLESTTYPGTTEELVAPILEEGSGLIAGGGFALGYSPERIDPGNQLWDLISTPKVVSGIDGPSRAAVQGFYDTMVTTTVPVSSPRTAELTKLLENTFRHVNIALVNELAVFAHDMGVDVWEAIDAASTKPFGYLPFTPGPGVGGHCLPVDPSYLSWRVKSSLGHNFRFVELANDVNDHMPDYVVRRVVGMLNREFKSVNGSRVLLLGLSYKRNTGDARESPAIKVAELLRGLGARVRAVDPYVEEQRAAVAVPLVDLTPDEIDAADVVVLLTDHDVFDYEMVDTHAPLTLDTRRRLTGDRVQVL